MLVTPTHLVVSTCIFTSCSFVRHFHVLYFQSTVSNDRQSHGKRVCVSTRAGRGNTHETDAAGERSDDEDDH